MKVKVKVVQILHELTISLQSWHLPFHSYIVVSLIFWNLTSSMIPVFYHRSIKILDKKKGKVKLNLKKRIQHLKILQKDINILIRNVTHKNYLNLEIVATGMQGYFLLFNCQIT